MGKIRTVQYTLRNCPKPKIRMQQNLKQKYIVRWLFEAKVYALTDFDDNVFYIGCTTKPLFKRLQLHIGGTKSYDSWRNSRKDEKVRALDFKVKIKELHSFGIFGVNKSEAIRKAAFIENQWIKKYLDAGCDLCNCIDFKTQTQKGSKKIA